MEVIPTLHTIEKTYNEEENAFIYPDFNTRVLVLPARALVYLTVVGNYIWEFKLVTYTDKVMMSGKFKDLDYNKENVASVVYRILSESIDVADGTVSGLEGMLPGDIMDGLKDRLIGHLVDSTVDASQLETIQEEIEWMEELELRED